MWADPLAVPHLGDSLLEEAPSRGSSRDAKRERRLTAAAVLMMMLLALGRETCWVESALAMDWSSAMQCRGSRLLASAARIGGSSSCAQEVWVIRHGEKSPDPAPDSPEVRGLNATGVARAQHLRMLVETGRWPRFRAVYASSPLAPPYVLREVQTVEPLAAAIGVPVNASFAQTDGEALAAAARAHASGCGGVVLISWEHCRIPALLDLLDCAAEQCAACWPDGAYDHVERLQIEPDGSVQRLPPTREGFRNDTLGFDGYECEDPLHSQGTRCALPDGRVLGKVLWGLV